MIIVNPDNPSGSYIPVDGIRKLIEWTGRKGISLVVDESFLDFSDELDSSLISQDILDANKHLYVIKSISKSYGVPGLRLGILASGDTVRIERLKKDVAIWNINSFAEFYMQIEEKYRRDYEEALKLLRAERTRLQKQLDGIDGIRVIPSQANYVMIELTGDVMAGEIARTMLIKYNLFVKDLSEKIPGGKYLRLAIRNEQDNDRLIQALKKELSKKAG